jgi:hypothetical protein
MKKKTIWGYPGLCLCLIVSLSIVSCAIRHDVKAAHTIPQAHFWIVDAVLLAGGPDYRLQGLFDRLSIRPNLVKGSFNPGQSKMLFLSFRVRDTMQVQSLREALDDTGMVMQINITPLLTN